MGNVLISIFLLELFFTMLLVINRTVDELLPIGEYKTWLQNKNYFGKIYTTITTLQLFHKKNIVQDFLMYNEFDPKHYKGK